jgi:hypothetical protein
MQLTYRHCLIGFFLLVIFDLPLMQITLEATRGEWPQALDVFKQVPTAGKLREFERDTENASIIAALVRTWVQSLRFALLHDPGDLTVLGRGGWLFYRPEVQYLVEPFRFADSAEGMNPVTAIVRFRDQLASRGIRLLVIPVPGKPSIYPELLSLRALSGGDLTQTHTQELITLLHRQGVETVDLRDPLRRWRQQGAGYLKLDTHWSPAAARRTAELVAERILSSGLDVFGSTEFVVKTVSNPRRGDLVRMLQSPPLEASFLPERVECEQVSLKTSGELYTDDVSSPVLVVGDSFLQIYQTEGPRAAGFIAHLARALRRPLTSIVRAVGPTMLRREVIDTPGLLTEKKLVIWEFAERFIRFDTDHWQEFPPSLRRESGEAVRPSVSTRSND